MNDQLEFFADQAKQMRLDEARSLDEANFSTFELRQSRRGTMKSTRTTTIDRMNTVDRDPGGARPRDHDRDSRGTMRSTVSRKSTNFAMINGSRQPPRPTPSMVNYSDEDSAKGYDENPDDSDSLTEKPSEISSTDSQVLKFNIHCETFFGKTLINDTIRKVKCLSKNSILTKFLVKLTLSTAKKSKTTTYSRDFQTTKKIDKFLGKSKLNFWTKMKILNNSKKLSYFSGY